MNADEVRAIAIPREDVRGWRWPNFTPEEIACRGTGRVPDPARCPQFADAMDRLQALRNHFGVPLIVTSGYRTPEHNRTIKGAGRNSYHMRGVAFDVSIVNVDPHAIEAKARDLGFRGIGRYALSRFIHVDARVKATTWGDPWPPGADRFDETTERPDGVEGIIARLYRKYRRWIAGGGSVAVLIEALTNVINRTWGGLSEALTGLTLPTLSLPPWWPYAALGIAAVVLLAIALIPEKKESPHERETDGRIDSPDRRGGAGASGGQHGRAPQPAPPRRRGAVVLAPRDPRRRWTA